ncbi:MAG: hypothetical protein QXK37_00980 [Candidatus Woesearchaeota archaeon]
MKRGQTWSIETYVAIGIFLIALIFFYSILNLKHNIGEQERETESIANRVFSHDFLADGVLTEEEVEQLKTYDCEKLKQVFDTNKKICIYFKDENGNIINLTSTEKIGIGCPDINIGGYACG